MEQYNILIVEDDKEIRDENEIILKRNICWKREP